MSIVEILTKEPAHLPAWITQLNLLTVFIVYATVIFLVSLLLRLRFYRAVWEICLYVRHSCPSIFKLLEEHWMMFASEGVITRTALYGVVFVPYLLLTRVLLPNSSVTFHILAEVHPLYLVMTLLCAGVLAGVDIFLVLQVSRVDAPRIVADLQTGEYWLGSRINRWLGMLGSYNPIMRYARALTQQNLVWFNDVFRNSLSIMLFQVACRISVAACLFGAVLIHPEARGGAIRIPAGTVDAELDGRADADGRAGKDGPAGANGGALPGKSAERGGRTTPPELPADADLKNAPAAIEAGS